MAALVKNSTCDVFLSLRFAEAMEEAKLVQQYLETKGLNTFICSVLPGNDIKEAVIDQLDGCKLAIIFGTLTYGRGSVNFSTKEEMEFILAENKPYFLIKMCDRFEEARTRFNFGPSVSFFPWPINMHKRANKQDTTVIPPGLGEAIIARYNSIIKYPETMNHQPELGKKLDSSVAIPPPSKGKQLLLQAEEVDNASPQSNNLNNSVNIGGSGGGDGGRSGLGVVAIKSGVECSMFRLYDKRGVEQDKQALDEFFDATGGEGWKYNTNWACPNHVDDNEHSSLSQRYGVKVDADTGRVVSLNFGGVKGLTGNNLIGEIPSCLSKLTELEELFLSSNRLRGHIPVNVINHLTKLKSLSFFNNRLSGSLEEGCFGSLTNLTYLSFSGNQLEGNIPDSLIQLTNLHQVWLDGNKNLILPEGVSDKYFGIPCAVDFESYRKSVKQQRHKEAVDISS